MPDTGIYRSVSAGQEHACALGVDDSVVCWNRSHSGRAGAPGEAYLAVSSSDHFGCGLRTDGNISCWWFSDLSSFSYAPEGAFEALSTGWPACGVRGDGSVACWDHDIVGIDGHRASLRRGYHGIAVGGLLSCALSIGGSPECWWNSPVERSPADRPPTPPEGEFTALSVSTRYRVCGLRDGGTITCWSAIGPPEDFPGTGYTDLARGFPGLCGLRPSGALTCWKLSLLRPEVEAPEGEFTALDASRSHMCAVTVDHGLVCWGDNSSGQIDIPHGSYRAVTAGGHHSCGLLTDGSAACWGNNSLGQLDAPDGAFAAIAATDNQTCGLRPDGHLECWGGGYGQRTYPLAGPFVDVAAGADTVCALRPDTTMICWAENYLPLPHFVDLV